MSSVPRGTPGMLDSPLRERIGQALYEHEIGDDRGIALPWSRAHQEPWLRAAAAALSTLTLSDHIAAVEAAGLVYVPTEPTEEQVDAGWVHLGMVDLARDELAECYRIMTAARPRDAG